MQQEVTETCTSFSAAVENTVILVDGLLKSIRHVYETSGTASVEQFLAEERLNGTAVVYFALASPDGNSFIFGDPGRATANLVDRPHFKVQQNATEDHLFIGIPNVGRLSRKTVIPLTRGLHLPTGRLGGMVMAGIEPSLLSSRFFDATKLGPSGVVAVIGLDGIIRAHGAAHAEGVGQHIADDSGLWGELARSDHGTYWQKSSVDGRLRRYVYRKLPDYPLVVTAGFAREDMQDRARARRLPYQMAYGLVLTLLLAVFALVLRQRMADVAVRHDRERLAAALTEIERHVYHDALTGLPNRLLLQDRLAQAIETARRTGQQLALMFIDLDDFKVVNDTFGHDAGDEVLKRAVARLRSCLHRDDTLARLGGDEFIVIRTGIRGSDEVAAVAGRIVDHLTDEIATGDRRIRVGASIGIALYPGDGEDVTTLMKVADTAMYQAKSAGRNTFRFFDVRTMEIATSRMRLEDDLARAEERGEFELLYQPKVSLRDRQTIGAEALIRWRSRERGLVPPGSFIPLAEETGQIAGIGRWVLRTACRQIAAWRQAGLPCVTLAVNVSALQLFDDSFVSEVAALLAEHGLEPSCLEIELTESAVMTEPDRAARQLQRLRDIGIAVAVDDFGTGYSSLSYLKRLPLSSIKIDQSFVRGVDHDADNAAIVAAVLGLARTLGLSVVAEGIESQAEENHLTACGCPVGQGRLYGDPETAGAFARRLSVEAGRHLAARIPTAVTPGR